VILLAIACRKSFVRKQIGEMFFHKGAANRSISTCSSVSILNVGDTLAVVMLRNMKKLVCLKFSYWCFAVVVCWS
jgi:hypothetical protein